MYERHFNFSQSPFSIAPDPSFLYLSSAHREALAHLMYGFSHGGFVMITGEVGTGKTTLLRNLLRQTPPDLDVAFILNPRLTVRELLATLCDELGVAYNPLTTTTIKQYIDLITHHLLETHRLGRSTVMIIDEAQNLSPAVLEQVRLLTNLETDAKKLLRIILIGQPELEELLERQELRQLAQRITARYHLGSLSRSDSYAYVMHRLSRAGGNPQTFTQPALRKLYALSKGVPRLINVIADRALLGAYTEDKRRVTARIVSSAAREVLGGTASRRNWLIGGAAAILAAGAAWALLAPVPLLPVREAEVAEPASPPAIAPAGVQQDAPEVAGADRGVGEPAASRPQESAPPTVTPVQAGARPPTNPVAAPAPTPAVASVVEPDSKPVATSNDPVPAADTVITPDTYAEMQARSQRQAGRAGSAPALRAADPPVTGSPLTEVESVQRPGGLAYAGHRQAYRAIFAAWGVDFERADRAQIPCDFAPSAGLQCLSDRGDWDQLERLDLPVVLELWDGGATPYYAALIGMADGRVRLQLGDRTVETTQHALRSQWSGAYVVLWQTPPDYYGSLRQGQRHTTVGWLRRQLTALGNRSLASPNPNQFDEPLRDAVLEFQAAEGLLTDGVVGPATWIRLADRLQLPQPSLAG